MISKVLCVLALVALASAQQGSGGHNEHGHNEHGHGYSSQYVHRHDGHVQEVKVPVKDHKGHEYYVTDYYAHPKYEFKYEVKDEHTHDIKSQQEKRDGDVVKGEYSLYEPDGSLRKVKYESDKKTGFQAQVKHETHHIVPEKYHH